MYDNDDDYDDDDDDINSNNNNNNKMDRAQFDTNGMLDALHIVIKHRTNVLYGEMHGHL